MVSFLTTNANGAYPLLRRPGLRRMAGLTYRAIADRIFDLLNKVDTAGYIERQQLGFDESSNEYQASPVYKIKSLLRNVPIDPRKFTLIDLGCGKGRVLVIARRFSFRRIIGVELSESLARVARENCRGFDNVSIVVCNGATFAFPDGPCVLYLANPFEASVLASVLDNVKERLSRDDSPIYIVYVVPQHRQLLDGAPFLKLVPSLKYCAMYVSAPLGEE